MSKIKFETGQIVNFEGTPTQADIDEVAQKLGITKKETAKMPSLTEGVIGGLPGIKQATQIGVGLGTKMGKFGIGIGQTASKIAGGVAGLLGKTKAKEYLGKTLPETMETIKQEVFQKPYEKELSTFGGKAGEVGTELTTFATSGGVITKGQQLGAGLVKGIGLGKKAGYVATKATQVVPEALGMGATQYAISGGDIKSAKEVGIASAVLSSITHVGADVWSKLIPQTVKENVARVFIPKGKISLKGVSTGKQTDDAVSALNTIKNMSKDITVKDIDGIDKPFIPEKATFVEMPQALYQAKNNIYKAYTDLATKAGDEGAKFTAKDFYSVIDDLKKYEGKGYTQTYTSKANQITEALKRFITTGKKGQKYFAKTDPSEIQKLIENINLDVNPLSDKAGSQVAQEASQKLRTIMDDKISQATGGEYQNLRTAYSQLKSIEPEILNQFKKAMRKAGVKPDLIDGIISVDGLYGLLRMNPIEMARAGISGTIKKAITYLRDPEVNLQRAFKLLGKGEKTPGAISSRFAKTPTTTEAYKKGESIGKEIEKMPNKEGGFIANPLAESDNTLITEAKKYKSAEEFVNKKLPDNPVKTTQNNYGETKTYKILEQSWNNKEPSVVMPKGSKVFRGGEEGVYYSADLGTAEGYAEGGAVRATDISGKKLANFQDFTNGKYASDPEVDLVSILKKAINEGYDGLYTRDNYGEVILPTKSQLTDIWKKANNPDVGVAKIFSEIEKPTTSNIKSIGKTK